MKQIAVTLLALLLMLGLTACGEEPGEKSPVSSTGNVPGTVQPVSQPQPAPSQPAQPSDPALAAFRAALEKLYAEQILPSGDKLETAEYSDITKAQFAILDLDQDGEEELVFTFSDTYTAGMATYVYAYNAEIDRLMVELWEFPSLSFYNTGIVEALASHNHGPAGDALWPFILYQYEPMTDDYRKVAVVDAWDSTLVGDTYDGKTFPTQADADGDGVVYYVMYDGYALEDPMDGPAFQNWYASWFQGTEEVPIPYQYLTEENIQALG